MELVARRRRRPSKRDLHRKSLREASTERGRMSERCWVGQSNAVSEDPGRNGYRIVGCGHGHIGYQMAMVTVSRILDSCVVLLSWPIQSVISVLVSPS
jgi:hypothetical protein